MLARTGYLALMNQQSDGLRLPSCPVFRDQIQFRECADKRGKLVSRHLSEETEANIQVDGQSKKINIQNTTKARLVEALLPFYHNDLAVLVEEPVLILCSSLWTRLGEKKPRCADELGGEQESRCHVQPAAHRAHVSIIPTLCHSGNQRITHAVLFSEWIQHAI